MFKELTINETTDLVNAAGTFARDCVGDVSLGSYPQYYRIRRGYQLSLAEPCQDLAPLLEEAVLPAVPDGWKATVVLEMAPGCPMSWLEAVHTWSMTRIGEERLERIEPVFGYGVDDSFALRITVVLHDAERRLQWYSTIKSQCRLLWDIDQRIARKLDDCELSRNEEIGTVVALDVDAVCDMMKESHFLWTDIASTTRSGSDIAKRFRPEVERIRKEYSVNGIILFVEVDRDHTTMGEVDKLKREIGRLVGNDVEIALNVRVRDSYIKHMTCRLVLVGGLRYLKGEVFSDFGRHEILLYESEDKERGHVVVASYAEGRFTLSRYDWGTEYNRRGETDDHHYFDEENTARLMAALHVRRPEALLRTIRRRFATRMPSSADYLFLEFCRKEGGIEFTSDYHY